MIQIQWPTTTPHLMWLFLTHGPFKYQEIIHHQERYALLGPEYSNFPLIQMTTADVMLQHFYPAPTDQNSMLVCSTGNTLALAHTVSTQ